MGSYPIGGPEYLTKHTGVAATYLAISGIASVVGTFGNLLILSSVARYKELRSAKNVFIVNLAICDLLVTAFANPLGITGMVLGRKFFEDRPVLCDIAATVCLASCVTALLSIGGISFNSCLHICYGHVYDRFFRLRNNILMCGAFWMVGISFSMPPLLGWADNIYDEKMLECIWDRQASLSYTIFFSLAIVFTPTGIIAVSFIKIFLHVSASKKRVAAMSTGKEASDKAKSYSTRLARSLFIIFAIFVFCWAPYAILVLVDFGDHAPYEVHLFVLLLAHMHASLNFIVYWATNKHFRYAYGLILRAFICTEAPDKKTYVTSVKTPTVNEGS